MVAATNPDDAASFWRPHLRLRHRTGTVHLLAFLAARSQRVLQQVIRLGFRDSRRLREAVNQSWSKG